MYCSEKAINPFIQIRCPFRDLVAGYLQTLRHIIELSGHRISLALLVLLISACDQAENLAMLDNKGDLANRTASISPYGRKAEFSYPNFSGSFAVATRTIVVTDPSRLETLESSSDPLQVPRHRKVQVRFYYPIDENPIQEPTDKNRLPVIAEKTWSYLIGHHELKGKRLRYENYRNAQWNIGINKPIAPQRASYPILIFSHGYGYSAESYSALSAELASRGFVVVSINHTYGANPVDFGLNHSGLIWAKPLHNNNMGASLPIWSADQMLVIEHLNLINSSSDDPFFQKLQLANIGVFGHSYGGAASFHTAALDPRVKAVMNLDGTIFDFENKSVNQPSAIVLSEKHELNFDFTKTAGEAFLIKLKGFGHASFSDHPLWWQWDHDDLELGFGKVDAYQSIALTSNLVDQFFSYYLLNKQSDMFELDAIDNSDMLLQRKK